MSTMANTIFSPELAARFDRLVTLYPLRRSALVPMLLYAQDEVGYLSDAVIAEIAARVEITELEVRNVLSYYSLLRTHPVGRYHLQVCTNISCMLRGAYDVFAHCERRLGIGNKQTTPDGLFSLEEVECIGACSWAPAAQVNYAFHENLTPESVDRMLDEYRAKSQAESHSGPQDGPGNGAQPGAATESGPRSATGPATGPAPGSINGQGGRP